MWRHLPNALTASRIVLGVLFPFLPAGWHIPVIVIAALTDWCDGALSRWLGVANGTGKYLDPISDKVFIAGVIFTLLRDGRLSPLDAILIGLRDLAVILGVIGMFALGRSAGLQRLRPTPLGKLTTVGQFLVLLTLLIPLTSLEWVIIPTVIVSGLAGVEYLIRGYRALTPPPAP